LGRKLIYELKVFLGYEKILNAKGIQTLYGRKNKKNKLYEGGKWRCAL
jgi:hypothetical protein